MQNNIEALLQQEKEVKKCFQDYDQKVKIIENKISTKAEELK